MLISAACKKSSGSAAHHVSIAGQNNGFATVWTDGIAYPLSTVFSDASVIKYYNGHLYVGGYQWALNGQIQFGYWVDGVFTQLYAADPTIIVNLQDLTVDGSDVYVTAWIDSAYYSLAFYWKNGQRIPLTGGPGTYYPVNQTSGIAVSNGNVYVSGTVLSNAAGHYFAAYWKNGVLIPVGDSLTDNTFASGIALSGSDVLHCGYDGNNIILWRNAVATTLSDAQVEAAQGSASIAAANGIFTDAADVYVAGSMVNDHGYNAVALWKDNNFVPLPDSTSTSFARSICAY